MRNFEEKAGFARKLNLVGVWPQRRLFKFKLLKDSFEGLLQQRLLKVRHPNIPLEERESLFTTFILKKLFNVDVESEIENLENSTELKNKVAPFFTQIKNKPENQLFRNFCLVPPQRAVIKKRIGSIYRLNFKGALDTYLYMNPFFKYNDPLYAGFRRFRIRKFKRKLVSKNTRRKCKINKIKDNIGLNGFFNNQISHSFLIKTNQLKLKKIILWQRKKAVPLKHMALRRAIYNYTIPQLIRFNTLKIPEYSIWYEKLKEQMQPFQNE